MSAQVCPRLLGGHIRAEGGGQDLQGDHQHHPLIPHLQHPSDPHQVLTGNYSVTGFQLILKRKMSHYIITYYFPAGMFVIVSWIR